MDPTRLTQNPLTSSALAFNLFGPLANDLELATAVFRKLFPHVQSVTGIIWEHAPARRGDVCLIEKSDLYLSDRSAFDLAVGVILKDGPATIYTEVKLSEAPNSAAKMRPRYVEASKLVRLYRDPESPMLRLDATEQIWRLHMLSQLCVDNGVTPRAILMTVCPSLNRQVQVALAAYEAELIDADQREPDRVAFAPLTLETVIEAIAAAGATELAQALWRRYCDLDQVCRLSLQEFADDDHTPSSSESEADVNKSAHQMVVTTSRSRQPATIRRGRARASRSEETPSATSDVDGTAEEALAS